MDNVVWTGTSIYETYLQLLQALSWVSDKTCKLLLPHWYYLSCLHDAVQQQGAGVRGHPLHHRGQRRGASYEG